MTDELASSEGYPGTSAASETVKKDDLRALVKRWNTREYHLGEAQPDKRAELEKCRRELEGIINE